MYDLVLGTESVEWEVVSESEDVYPSALVSVGSVWFCRPELAYVVAGYNVALLDGD